MSCYRQANGTIYLRYLRNRGDILHVAKTCATILSWHQHTHQPELAHLMKYLDRKFLRLIPLHHSRAYELIAEVAYHLRHHRLAFRLLEINCHRSFSRELHTCFFWSIKSTSSLS